MIKKLFFLALAFISTGLFSQTYQLTGNPVNTAGWTLVPVATVNTDFIQLTPDQTSQFGVIKLNNMINLKYCDKWKVEFDFRIDGNGTPAYGKGDGFAFWYLSNPPTGYVPGSGLGIPANSTGFMTGFDIFNNTTEAQMSQVHVLYGVNNVGGNNIEYNNTAGSTFHSPNLMSTINFQNGNYHHVEVNGQTDPANPANWIITVKIDNITVVNQSFAPAGAAAAMTGGYFGFSAATGAASARHSIKNAKIYVDKVPLIQASISPQAPCPDAVTGLSTVNLTTYNAQLVANPANYTFTYYVSGNPTPIANPSNFQFSGSVVVKVVVKDPTNTFCDNPDATINLAPLVIPKSDVEIKSCEYNGSGIFDLTQATVTTLAAATKKYYPSLADLNAGTNEIVNPTAYPSAGGTVYVKIMYQNCSAIAKITLSFNPKPVALDAVLISCFIPVTPTIGLFNLTDAVITPNSALVSKKYYPSLADATNDTNQITGITAYLSPTATVYARVINNFNCYSIAKINLIVTSPKYSAQLVDKIICVEDRTTLDAGPGYTAYEWSTGATTQSVSGLSVGEYWVNLSHDGCVTKQIVKILKSPDPVITHAEIVNSSVTLTVSGGKPPYKYSLDGTIWQDSNVFTNLPRGENTFYVKDSYDCDPVQTQLTVPNLVNAITPNGDNINDVIDYSQLAYKKNLEFSVFDRYGNRVFMSDTRNNYRWDGRQAQKKVPTGTYWYYVTWTETNQKQTTVKYSGWIMVRNHD